MDKEYLTGKIAILTFLIKWLAILGVELRTSHFLGTLPRHAILLEAHPLSFFALANLPVGNLAWSWPQTTILLPISSKELRSQTHTTTSSYWLRWGLTNYLPGLISNSEPPNFHLPSSWNYKNESPVPAPNDWFLNLSICLNISISTFQEAYNDKGV
jgi:hypothetical protein